MSTTAASRFNVEFSESFLDSVQGQSARNDQYLGQVWETINVLKRKPFGSPKIQTHQVGKARNGKTIYSSDVGGRKSDRRLVWQLFNRTIVLLLYGQHKVQDRAKRISVAFDPNEQRVVVTVAAEGGDAVEQHYAEHRLRAGRLFMAWDDRELAEFGFADHVVEVLRALDSDDELLELETAMAKSDFDRALNLLLFDHPDGEAAAAAELDAVIEAEDAAGSAEEPEATDEDVELEAQLLDPSAGAWFSTAEPEFLKEILDKPIEDWMVFLHPEQREIVERTFSGPARVRGSAGTGKTVVGLHRAAYLAKNREGNKPILFTTFVKSLPPVFESLYARLPGANPQAVEFVHIDRLARQICRRAGLDLTTTPKLIDQAYTTAWNRLVTRSSPLGIAGFSARYVRDEITIVIKGRGLRTLDEYLEVRRTGRRAALGKAQRAQVWELMTEWDTEMARLGTVDFADVIMRARDVARGQTEPTFHAAIIDEAQDLTLVGLQLVRSLVNGAAGDRPNALMILGDGAQRIYPGGFTLKQAGITVTGRSALLKTNYRNTDEIVSLAMAVTGDLTVSDHGEEFKRGDAPATALRSGTKPLLVEANSVDDEIDWIMHRLPELVESDRIGYGDIGLLVPTNRLANRLAATLEEAGVPVEKLEEYDGRSVDAVRVGTFHRGKGLEFKAVFLPGMARGRFPLKNDEAESEDELAESFELGQSQLFVAMTRARDLLVVSYDREPSEVLIEHLDRFERVEA